MPESIHEETKINTRRKSNFYELTLSLVAKRLHKLYPDDHFKVEAFTWCRPTSFKISVEPIEYRIWSNQLNYTRAEKSAVTATTLERAFKEMCELKNAQEPRKVENFLKEEKMG